MSEIRSTLINRLNEYRGRLSQSRLNEFSREARMFISLSLSCGNPRFTAQRLVEVFDFGFRNHLSWEPTAGHISLLVSDDGDAGFYVHYRGHLVLAAHSQIISRCTAELIYETDDFEYRGEDQRPKLIRKPTKTPGDVVGGYTISYLPDGAFLCQYFDYEALLKAEQIGVAAGNAEYWCGPHRREMQRKTLIICSAKRWNELRLMKRSVDAA